mgnify:CR=1 FL=1
MLYYIGRKTKYPRKNEEKKMRVDDGFVLREIAGDYVIIPTGKTVLDFNGMITVNEVGVSIWKMLQEETTFENNSAGYFGMSMMPMRRP